jgi:hypothetical protein
MRFYDFFFYCSCGSHYVTKENAVIDEKGAPRCPVHKRKLRTTSPCSGGQRDRLYPRSRVTVGLKAKVAERR